MQRFVIIRNLLLSSALLFLMGCSSIPPSIAGEINLLERNGYERRKELPSKIASVFKQYAKTSSQYPWLFDTPRLFFLEHSDRGWVVLAYNHKNTDSIEYIKLKINEGVIYAMYGLISNNEPTSQPTAANQQR